MISHLDDVRKVFSFNVVVSLDEDLSEDRFSNGVVFGVELVKPMERVTVLISKETSQTSFLYLMYNAVFLCT